MEVSNLMHILHWEELPLRGSSRCAFTKNSSILWNRLYLDDKLCDTRSISKAHSITISAMKLDIHRQQYQNWPWKVRIYPFRLMHSFHHCHYGHFFCVCPEVNWMKLPQMDSVWQNPEVKKSSVLRDWGTGFGGFMGNPARQQEENLFFYFKSFYKRICVCVCVCVCVCD